VDDLVLGDREMDVMAVLWDRGSGTVAEVRDLLPDGLAYTTVLTVLRNLERKGVIAHVVAGQAHRYVPVVARAVIRRSALSRLLAKLFAGAPEQLLAHLVEEHSFTPDDLRRLRAQIDTLEERTARDAASTSRSRKPGPARQNRPNRPGRGRK
jgi:BlaI family transcriptional regulator, penicillinase repressor